MSVKVDTPIDDVTLDFEKYDLVAMPVVDSIGRLLGRITVDDVMDQVRESTERDYQLASGLSSDVDADDSIFAQTKARIPWLLIGIASGILASLILGTFEAKLEAVTALALLSRLSVVQAVMWACRPRLSWCNLWPTARSKSRNSVDN